MTHDLHVHETGTGLLLGACSCGSWEFKVGPDALVGQAGSLEEVVEQVHALHKGENAQEMRLRR